MSNQVCVVCKADFKNKDVVYMCDYCRQTYYDALINNRKFRKDVIEILLDNEDFIIELTKKIFNQPEALIGSGGPSTIAHGFRKKKKKKRKKTD